MTGRLCMLLVATLAIVVTPGYGAGADPRHDAVVEVQIDPATAGPGIDPNIFGQFAEHLGAGIYGGIWVGRDSSIPNVRGIRSDVVGALRALHVPNVRWPGGCFADEYHWRDGVGASQQRKVTLNSNWGGSVEPNAFGSDEFMDFIEQIGSEAYLSINVGSGTPREAADWLAYLTAPVSTSAGQERAGNGHAAPYRIKFLGIGNESWGCGGAMSPEYYLNQLKIYSRFVRNFNPLQSGDQTMRRIAVGADGADTSYVEADMHAWHDRVWSWSFEGLSLHSYTSAGWPPAHPSEHFDEREYALFLKDTLRMDALIGKHSALMDRYDPDRKVALAVDEWGVWLAPLPGSNPGFLVQQNSLRDGIVAALNLNIFARHAERVRMANIAQMVNVLQSMIITQNDRMVLTPTYHVFRMYVPFQNAQRIAVRLDAGVYAHDGIVLPRLDALAAVDAQHRIWLAVVNLDPTREAPLAIAAGQGHAHSAKGEVLTAQRVDSVNSFAAPDAVAPRPIAATLEAGKLMLLLPAKSVAVVQIQ
jgi:alpha-N-arabinofuranosidase